MLKIFRQRVGRNWIGTAGCLVLGAVLFVPRIARTDAATARPSSITVNIPAGATPEVTEFLQNRAVLMAKLASLSSNNASPTPQAVAQFQQENAALLSRQTQLAQIIAQQQAMNPTPVPPPLHIPPNGSPQMKAFLTAREQLMRDQIAFMNQHQNDDQPTRDAANAQWQQHNAKRMQHIQQMAQAISQQQSANPIPPPPPLHIPSSASPQMEAFLKTRDHLMRSQIALMNQHLTDDHAAQQAALQQWQKQNSALIQQMQQQAQALSNSN